MTALPYGAIRVLDVEPDNPRVLVRLELTYAELANLQRAVYPGVGLKPQMEVEQAHRISDKLLHVIRGLALEDQDAYKELAPGYIQESLW